MKQPSVLLLHETDYDKTMKLDCIVHMNLLSPKWRTILVLVC